MNSYSSTTTPVKDPPWFHIDPSAVKTGLTGTNTLKDLWFAGSQQMKYGYTVDLPTQKYDTSGGKVAVAGNFSNLFKKGDILSVGIGPSYNSYDSSAVQTNFWKMLWTTEISVTVYVSQT